MKPIAVITGADHGIAVAARLFGAKGHDDYLSNHDAAARVIEDCRASGARAVVVSGNVNAIRVDTVNTRILSRGGDPDRPGKIAAITRLCER